VRPTVCFEIHRGLKADHPDWRFKARGSTTQSGLGPSLPVNQIQSRSRSDACPELCASNSIAVLRPVAPHGASTPRLRNAKRNLGKAVPSLVN
jgi:hypothetical protein